MMYTGSVRLTGIAQQRVLDAFAQWCGERLMGSPGGHHFYGPPRPGRGIDSTLLPAYFMRLSS